MVKRFFWFAIGAGVAIFVYVKVRNFWQQARPAAVGSRVADSAAGLGSGRTTSPAGSELPWPNARRSSAPHSTRATPTRSTWMNNACSVRIHR